MCSLLGTGLETSLTFMTTPIRTHTHTHTRPHIQRYTGDVQKVGDMQLFAWEATRRGKDVHMQANPTQMARLYKQFEEKKSFTMGAEKASILERYGGEEHLDAPPKELLLAQSEAYVEYSQTGRVIKGLEKALVRSKYVEDVCLLNHTSVWGSWWCEGQWGYKCCHATIKQAYCTGQAGIEAAAASATLLSRGAGDGGDGERAAAPIAAEREATAAKARALLASAAEGKRGGAAASSSGATAIGIGQKRMLGEGKVELDAAALAAALAEERLGTKKFRQGGDLLASAASSSSSSVLAGRGNKYNSGRAAADDGPMTEERLEAYRMARSHAADPMAAFLEGGRSDQGEEGQAQPRSKGKGKAAPPAS